MDPLTELQQKLTSRGLRHDSSHNKVHIPSASDDGFAITLTRSGQSFVVAFEGWHEPFESPEEALNCVVFGLSTGARLRVRYAGSVPYKWILESRQDGVWVEDSQTGLLLFPFWVPRRERVLQNRVLDLGS